ncbi:hypothetical protein BD779DRAFT_1478385 [Infundibulicybe gibba]|nr:hypothetical protein BD779DRAFT_1478385 [Infundibulicybe gibba]
MKICALNTQTQMRKCKADHHNSKLHKLDPHSSNSIITTRSSPASHAPTSPHPPPISSMSLRPPTCLQVRSTLAQPFGEDGDTLHSHQRDDCAGGRAVEQRERIKLEDGHILSDCNMRTESTIPFPDPVARSLNTQPLVQPLYRAGPRALTSAIPLVLAPSIRTRMYLLCCHLPPPLVYVPPSTFIPLVLALCYPTPLLPFAGPFSK